MLMPDGTLARRTRGTPQGSPISPLIANIFLHYGFDIWMTREFPGVRFERFADDVVVHCVTERQARQVCEAIGRRSPTSGCNCIPTRRGSCTARTTDAAWTLSR
jgi:RNA-directed DNA polymerase